MNTNYIRRFMLASSLLVIVLASTLYSPVLAAPVSQETSETEPPSETSETPTEDPTPTSTPPPPPAYARPQIMLGTYYIGSGKARPGQDFTLKFQLRNDGQNKARNVVVIFSSGDFIPRKNGGVLAAGAISPGASTTYEQPLTANSSLQESSIAVLSMQVTYSDDAGVGYSDAFSLGISLSGAPITPSSSGYSGSRSPTPTPLPPPQLLIRSYRTDETILQPGSQFKLSLEVYNVGGSPARRVTMVMGGGMSVSTNGSSDASSGDTAAGLSGGGGDYSNFAPIGSSNVQFLGDLSAQGVLTASQWLIVNSSTKPGAYPLRISFLYSSDKGASITDDQVITLMVLSPPSLDISLYRPADPFFAGQPGMLPLQVINLGRNSIMLGRLEASAPGAQIENNSTLVGYLDAGGFFTIDPFVTADQPGTLTIVVRIDYLDDFNQPQVIQREISVEVLEGQAPDMMPGVMPQSEFMPTPAQEETLEQTIKRLILGLLGLDSGPSLAGGGLTPSYLESPLGEMESTGIILEEARQ